MRYFKGRNFRERRLSKFYLKGLNSYVMLRPKLFMLWPSVEISMFPLILPYGIFVEAHSYGNAFFKVFKYRTKQNNTYLLTIVC